MSYGELAPSPLFFLAWTVAEPGQARRNCASGWEPSLPFPDNRGGRDPRLHGHDVRGARALRRAGFVVPLGYFTQEEEAEMGEDEETKLRRWIGRERNAILRAARRDDFLPGSPTRGGQ
jgi:hypothetical protein